MILRAQVVAPWSSFYTWSGRVVSTHEDPNGSGHYAMVWLDGEAKPLRFGLDALDLDWPPPDRSSER